MLADFFNALLAWIQQNPHWAYLGVFLVSVGESLTIVGLFLPGVAIMFGVGALVAAGALELWPTLLWAAAGAVVGDGASFWLGRHFHQRLRVIWPFRRYPALMNRGVDFFHRHGGKSVVLARFIGPVRPILPAVAGMLDMPPQRFFTVNILSALLWAPAYILPGVVFGASLGLAAEVAGRLATLVLVLVAVIWFGLWLVRRILRFLQPRAGFLLTRTLDWSRRRRWAEPLVAAVLEPDRGEARGLAALVVLLALASVVTTWLFGGWLSGLDLYLFEALNNLRTPLADQAMIFVTGLGDTVVLAGVLLAGGTWLLLRRSYGAALHWLAAVASTLILTRLLKISVAAPRPLDLYDGISAFSFPSGHTSLSVAVYGFLAVLIARELPLQRRWLPYTTAALLVIPIGFSRLYLGAHWLSDALGGLVLGLACLALFGIAYRRHPAHPLRWPSLAAVTLAALATLTAWHTRQDFDAQLTRYAPPPETVTHAAPAWWEQTWQTLPAQRHDFRTHDRQPLNIQYAGDPGALADALAPAGWHRPPALSATGALQWLVPNPEPAALPVLPQVHDGLHDELRLVRATADGHLFVLRLWPTTWRLDGTTPLWIGSATELQLHHRLYVFSYLVTGPDTAAALARATTDLAERCEVAQRHRNGKALEVLLVRDCPRAPGDGPRAKTLGMEPTEGAGAIKATAP